jgi:hypothetical protein
LAVWIPAAPENDPLTFRQLRDKWIASIDWFLASFILNAYEDWQRRVKRLADRDRDEGLHKRLSQLDQLIPMSFNAEKLNNDDDDEYRRYKFQFLSLYRALRGARSVYQRPDNVRAERPSALERERSDEGQRPPGRNRLAGTGPGKVRRISCRG